MKMKKTLFYPIALLLIVLLFSSCKMRSTSLEVLIPAEIDIPQHVQSVAVANRSLPEKGNKLGNIFEGIITGEPLFADREGSNQCTNGLVYKLNESPRFSAVLATSDNLYGTGTRAFATHLSWSAVDSICKNYKADALILLEAFDSNTGKSSDSRRVKKKDKDGNEYYVTEYSAEMCINVNAGWRIYDNVNQVIIDQNSFIDEKCWRGRGETLIKAERRLPSQRAAINDAGYFSGEMYGVRISPNWILVSRRYFVKGDPGFENAKEQIKYDNWEAAETIWLELSNSADPKIAGRACYNLALANEIDGNLKNAIVYANKALKMYQIKQARQYLAELEQRQRDQERLDKQLQSE